MAVDKTLLSPGRQLDDLIMAGTSHGEIVDWLIQNEDRIQKIYDGSAFVYQLYDFSHEDVEIQPFLMRHIGKLSSTDFYFAYGAYHAKIRSQTASLPVEAIAEVKSKMANGWTFDWIRRSGFSTDEAMASRSVKVVDEFSIMDPNSWEYELMMNSSWMSRSVLMSYNFGKMKTEHQERILRYGNKNTKEAEILDMDGKDKHDWHRIWHSLARQYLLKNELSQAKAILKRIDGLDNCGFNEFIRYYCMPDSVRESLEGLKARKKTASEFVFDVNMASVEFEPDNIVIACHGCLDRVFSKKKDRQLADQFFNLPFKIEDFINA